MGLKRKLLVFAALIPAFAAGSLASWAQLEPLGAEERLDGPFVPLGNSLSCPLLVGRDDGGALAAWIHFDGSGAKVQARALRPAGDWAPRRQLDGPPSQVVYVEDLAPAAVGFTALWRRYQTEPDGTARTPHVAQALDLDGVAQGEVLDLARGGTSIWAHADGFVVVWAAGRTLNVQRLDAAGDALGPPAKIGNANPYPYGGEIWVAAAAGGDFVVAWNGYRQARWLGLWVQRFGADGRRVGAPARLLPGGNRAGTWPYLGLAADGTLAVAWTVNHGSRRSPDRATLRTFDAANRPLGPAVGIGPHDAATSEHTAASSLAVDPDGRVLLVWTEYGAGGAYRPRLHARLFDRRVQPLGDSFAVAAPDSPEPDGVCSHAAWIGGSWVVARSAWRSEAGMRQIGTWARRFAAD